MIELRCQRCHGNLERAGPDGAILVCPSCKKGAWAHQCPGVGEELRAEARKAAKREYTRDTNPWRAHGTDLGAVPVLHEGM